MRQAIDKLVNASAARQRCALTPLEKAAADAILKFIDPIAYGSKIGCDITLVSRNRIDRHLHAIWAKQYCNESVHTWELVHNLTRADIARHLSGEKQLFVRSRWNKGRLLIRFDIDQHHGQTDGLACLDWLRTYLPNLYCCKSTGGYSGYIWLKVPDGINDDGEVIPSCTLKEMNRLVETIHKAAAALAKSKGYLCGVEVHGSFLERANPQKDENGVPLGPQTVAKMGTTVKLPTFANLADVEAFSTAIIDVHPRMLSAPFTDAGLLQLLDDGGAVIETTRTAADRATLQDLRIAAILLPDERLEAACIALAIEGSVTDCSAAQLRDIIAWRPARKPGERKQISRIIISTDNKLSDTRACIVRARRLLGITTRIELESRQEEVIQTALDLYCENQLGDEHRDKKRLDRFASAFKFLGNTFSEAKAGVGNDSNWFDEDHLNDLETKFRSTAAVAPMMETFNASRHASKHGRLSYRHLAVISATLAKNSVCGKDGSTTGEVPNKALQAMLKHPRFDLPFHGSIVAAAKKIICIVTRCIDVVAAHVKAGWQWLNGARIYVCGRATTYRIAKWGWFSFLSHHAPAVSESSQSATPTTAAPFSFSPEYKGELTPSQINNPTFGGLEDGYYEALAEQNPEFCSISGN